MKSQPITMKQQFISLDMGDTLLRTGPAITFCEGDSTGTALLEVLERFPYGTPYDDLHKRALVLAQELCVPLGTPDFTTPTPTVVEAAETIRALARQSNAFNWMARYQGVITIGGAWKSVERSSVVVDCLPIDEKLPNVTFSGATLLEAVEKAMRGERKDKAEALTKEQKRERQERQTYERLKAKYETAEGGKAV